MKLTGIALFLLIILSSCNEQVAESDREPLLEVEGKFLYEDQVRDIIPPNVSAEDSALIADSYIKKWVTDVLLYENAKRNVTDKAEIDRLLEEYKKSLTIHQYQQKLISERLPKTPSEEEMIAFYEQYEDQFVLKENLIQGILLVVPKGAPKIANVRTWVQSGNTKSLEHIEKYSIQHALSYDYFGNRWMPLTEILKKMPVQLENPSGFVASTRFFETQDSTRQYFLRIMQFKRTGDTEPYERAREKISTLIMNKRKTEFISNFENELYKEALEENDINFIKKNNPK